MKKKHLVVIGSGFAGLNCVKNIKKNLYDITIIDAKNHHVFQPLLYQVATAGLAISDIATPIREIFKNREDIQIYLGEVIKIDHKKNKVILKDHTEIDYDMLVICSGNQPTYYGKDQWREFTIPLKTIDHSIEIRNQILLAFEKAENNRKRKDVKIRFAIIGGGPTGVELAGTFAEVAFKTLRDNFRNFKTEDSEILLIEAAPKILLDYPRRLSTKAKKYLTNFGVKVKTNAKIKNISKSLIELEGEKISCDLIVWAAGNKVANFIKDSKLPSDSRSGRVLVDKHLSVQNSANIFAIGDVCLFKNPKGKALPGIAPVAIQQGIYLAKRLNNLPTLKHQKEFRYLDKGTLATIGRSKAVGVVFGVHFSGLVAWLLWSFVHIAYLVGFRNKVVVMFEWLILYFTQKRGSRIITYDKKD